MSPENNKPEPLPLFNPVENTFVSVKLPLSQNLKYGTSLPDSLLYALGIFLNSDYGDIAQLVMMMLYSYQPNEIPYVDLVFYTGYNINRQKLDEALKHLLIVGLIRITNKNVNEYSKKEKQYFGLTDVGKSLVKDLLKYK